MRNFQQIVQQILQALPDPAPAEVADELTVLRAELQILLRTGAYTPAEANASNLWERLQIALYRYLPNPAGYTWAQTISNIVTGN